MPEDPEGAGALGGDTPSQAEDVVAAGGALAGATYPATREDLVDRARANGAAPDVVDLLQRVPDRRYESAEQVFAALGGEMRG